MLKKYATLLLFTLICVGTFCGCKRILYIVPNAITMEFPTQAPMTVGLLIEPAVRDTWYKWDSLNARKRVDVPVGKLALDFGRSGMKEAFADFYVERYRDRRSEKGILVVLDRIKYDLEGEEVILYADVHIEDEESKTIFEKTYSVSSDEAKAGLGIPFISKKAEPAIEENTALAFNRLYREIVLDIYVLSGFLKVEPAAVSGPDEAAENIEEAEVSPLEMDEPVIKPIEPEE